ncbi:excreted virulence factor EspC (type VII ESX diderm) [Prauserella shujinwangii]|uniref:Excreted virulence factor EspC (Type VII ESX diderm) n=1 Tax=Prauserella shujinwangii TaxID=1453103 RepID=A0A2T0LW97_9PSEU|nr:type VII secretion target [Prauserella shujinwangii]PRX48291.1 excreted virulence factor EspC (type VII ESX diderm) [Prauserella shujinwangii]
MGFEVEPRSLRDAAGSAADAAQRLRGVELTVVADLAGALPGAKSAAQAEKLGAHWERQASTWAGGMDDYGEKLVAAADAYDAGDRGAAGDLGG